MDLKCRNLESGAETQIAINDAIFGLPFNEALVHQVVTAYRAGSRAGTKAQKTRSEVSGGGKKPWRQKGTGRARAGTIRSPLWKGGGVIFAAKPRSFDQKVNKTMYRQAMKSIISELVRSDRLIVVNQWELTEPKTKELSEKLKKHQFGSRVLFLLEFEDIKMTLASRNMPGVSWCLVDHVDPISLISVDSVIITESALKQLEERLA